MKSVKLGESFVNPSRDDFFRKVIEERKGKQKSDPLYYFLKILANAGCYGIYAEVNRQQTGKNDAKRIGIFSGDISRTERACEIELPGPWFFSPASALITSGGRCLVAMLEKMVTDAGGVHLMCDTDSMAIVASEHGELVPCNGGEHKMPDGRDAIKALSWSDTQGIVNRFSTLNPKEGRDQECDVPIWIKEGWQWILDRALGLPSQKPDWFNLPVMRRIAITTPNVMAALRRLDRDQARPYNFALSPVVVNLSDTPITLLGPFEKNSACWAHMPYINIHDGKTHTLKPPTIPVIAQTFETVFSQYVRHPEYKSLAPDGTPCKADSHGLLTISSHRDRFPPDREGNRARLGTGGRHKYFVAVVNPLSAEQQWCQRIPNAAVAADPTDDSRT